jgi:hypothetical protein
MADLVTRNGRKLHGISRGRRSSQSLNGINAVRGVPMVATRFNVAAIRHQRAQINQLLLAEKVNVATHAGSRDVHRELAELRRTLHARPISIGR